MNSRTRKFRSNGLPTAEAKKKITAWLEAKGLGKKTINYKLRDWLFSRQRYWGEPFPIVWKRDADGNLYHEALPESALARCCRPTLDDFKPTSDGEPPLARAKDWVNLPDGSMRETNTMPQWAGSCWYYLRYLDAQNRQRLRASQRGGELLDGHASQSRLRNSATQRRRPELISTSAAPSTPCCTCSTRVSGTRFCSISATSRRLSRFSNSSTRD